MVQSLVREQPDGVKRVSHHPWPNHTHLSDTSTPVPRSDGVKMNPEPHLSIYVCDIWEEILRITRRRTGEISKCERDGKDECERRDTLQLIDFIVKKASRTMNNGATAYYQDSCKGAGAKQTRVNMNEKMDLWEDQSHFVFSNYF